MSTIIEFCFNVDDMTPEAIGFAMETFFKEGAVESFCQSIMMKKSRPGHLIYVMCREEDREKFLELIFKHTTTLGVRENISKRYSLERHIETVESQFGPIRKKVSTGYGVTREKYEYEDLAAISAKTGLSLEQIKSELE